MALSLDTLTTGELELLSKYVTQPEFLILDKLFRAQREKLRDAAFNEPYFGKMESAIIHGERLGQDTIMKEIINLKVKIEGLITIRQEHENVIDENVKKM